MPTLCRTCRHLAFRSINVGGMHVGMWGCPVHRLRFGRQADLEAGKWTGERRDAHLIHPQRKRCADYSPK